jgi:hypothetical protein
MTMLWNSRRLSAIALSALLLAVLGCGALGLPGGGGTTTPPPEADRVVTGEVAWVDPGSRELEVQHQTGRVVARFDDRTSVNYQGREYRPENLEPGDVVRMDVAGSGYQSVYAQRIEVLESVSDRGDDPYDDDPADERHGDDVLAGEVERVDTGRREIRIETSHGHHVVRYDDRTRVYYRGDAYGPENLEPGDLVRVEAVESRGGDAYADRIEVTQAVQDRTGAGDANGAERLTGTVEWIDERRGEFGLRTDGRETWTVEVPFDARDSVRDRFARLAKGDYVRIEAEERGRDRVELVRFL